MLKLKKTNYEITNGTSFARLSLNVSLDRLVELLGQVSFLGSEDHKTQLEWVFYESSQRVFSIYDYKSDKLIHQIDNWHVGGKGFEKEEIVDELTKIGFTKDEIVVKD